MRVVLFGSWARGTHTVASDVDLLIVYEGERREDAFALTKSMLALPGIVLFPANAATEGPR